MVHTTRLTLQTVTLRKDVQVADAAAESAKAALRDADGRRAKALGELAKALGEVDALQFEITDLRASIADLRDSLAEKDRIAQRAIMRSNHLAHAVGRYSVAAEEIAKALAIGIVAHTEVHTDGGPELPRVVVAFPSPTLDKRTNVVGLASMSDDQLEEIADQSTDMMSQPGRPAPTPRRSGKLRASIAPNATEFSVPAPIKPPPPCHDSREDPAD